MESAHRNYLAIQLLSDQNTISYRNVARALKVHVNAAKRILYEFHAHENGKKPGSIHATYLLAGVKKSTEDHVMTNGHFNGVDADSEPIPSSPPPFTSSMLQSSQQDGQHSQNDTLHVRTITLVREEALEAMKAQYESVSSIHVYSLSPYRLQDLQTLTDIRRDLFNTVFVKEDPLQYNKTYGVIQNSGVRRRTGKRPPISEAPASKFKAVPEEPKKSAPVPSTSTSSKPAPTLKKEESSRPSSAGSTTTASSTKQPTLKRDTSDIFKSFSKAKSKPKLEQQGSSASNGADSPAQSVPEDNKMTDADEEGDSEDEALFLDTKTRKFAKKRPSEDGDMKKDKAERAAKLRKMMDSDDEAIPAPKQPKEKDEPSKQEEKDAEDADVAWSESDTERKKAPNQEIPVKEEPAITSTEPKRRRGKRKVTKKRTMEDEEGYFVTKEETVWESFSEDEPVSQPKPKALFPSKAQSQTKSSGGKATGKAAGKGGNIMNFFGKR